MKGRIEYSNFIVNSIEKVGIVILILEDLLYNDLFFHEYQPIYILPNQYILGYEAFFRSEFSSNPEQVFQSARQANRLYELDTKAIVSSIFNFSKNHKTDGKLLFLNIYPSTIENPEFFTFIDHLLASLTFPCHQIVLEINEGEEISDIYRFSEMISHLREYGFLIAVDDVGKGESSLQKIIELEPNFIKLDRYFAIHLSTSAKKQRLIHFLLNFCEDYSHIILEGVEDPEDLIVAKSIGIPIVQGFLLGKPKLIDKI